MRALTTGLAKALDPSDTLGRFPLTARAFRDLESEADAQARRAAIGEPTLRGRNDRLLHFVVSAALTSLLSEGAAWMAGVAKELADLRASDRFSVGDLLADRAGIVFARRLSTGDRGKNLAWTGASFSGEAVVPPDAGLPDRMSSVEFEATFGSVTDPRFAKLRDELVAAVEALPYLRPATAPPADAPPKPPPDRRPADPQPK